MKILIVEDDPVLALTLGRMIEEMGHEVFGSVTRGSEAIVAGLKEQCELILMDIMLQDQLDGIEAYRRIRESREVPVIYVTGNSDSLNRRRAAAIGYHDFLPKPVTFETLHRSIRSLSVPGK